MTTGLVKGIKASGLRAGAASRQIFRFLNRGVRDEGGITAIEYALLAALIALAIVTAVTGVGTTLQNVLTDIASSI